MRASAACKRARRASQFSGSGQMGTMVGRAASLCVKNGWSPRELGLLHWGALEAVLRNPGPERPLARQGRYMVQNRIGVKNEILYWARLVYHLPYAKPCALLVLVAVQGLALVVFMRSRWR